jgi:signal transduction histidine kinase
MDRPADWLPRRISYLVSGLYFGAVFLRSILIYKDTPNITRVMGLLLAGLLFYISEPPISRRFSRYFSFYLGIQTVLVLLLLATPGFSDFYGALLPIISMQIMFILSPTIGALWIALCALLMVLFFKETYGSYQAVALSLVYTAGNVLLGTYSLAIRRAQAARRQSQELAAELEAANQQLKEVSAQLEQLAVARERNRLARELHDSVTQTVFSMNLTTQSALLLLDREPGQVPANLERLNLLAKSALSEMQMLISELKPDPAVREGLVRALRRHISERRISDNLTVSLEVEGEQALDCAEEQGLFHIAVEALNNIMKHAQTSHASVRLHLAEPFWMEIADQGKGFHLRQTRSSDKIGLSSMRERAEEIGWDFRIITLPGSGTSIRVEKARIREVRHEASK